LVLYTGKYCKINLDKFCVFSKFEQNDRKCPFKRQRAGRFFWSTKKKKKPTMQTNSAFLDFLVRSIEITCCQNFIQWNELKNSWQILTMPLTIETDHQAKG
jgi:hypothetical protein